MTLFRHITPLTAAALLLTSCFSSGKLVDESVVDTRTPMVFGTSVRQDEETETKAAVLPQGFKVNTWKSFGSAAQQTVMDGFKVDYTPTASSKWDYVGVLEQVQRYWDLGAFPYEFRAVSPWSEDVTITETGVSIDRMFYAQTLLDGVYNKEAAICEPFVVAQVSREDLGKGVAERYVDRDLIKGQEINAAARADGTRSVHMPFHHLLCKVGFRLFIDDPQPSSPDYVVTLQSVEVSVVKDGFLTKGTYAATATQGLGSGTFADDSPKSGEYCILKRNTEYPENMREYLNINNAFDLTPGELHQIPQGNVKLRVKLRMQTHHGSTVDGNFSYETEIEPYTWAPDTRHIYYLHVPNLHAHEVELYTCEILPWEIVESEDIPVDVE
jgi:hypothetical protein